MKKVFCIIIISVMVMVFATGARADTAIKKLGRGIANMVTCPLEITKRMGEVSSEDGPFAGFTWGVLSGVVDMGKRAVVGAYETVAFPLPLPKGYAPILTDPEFFLSDKTDLR